MNASERRIPGSDLCGVKIRQHYGKQAWIAYRRGALHITGYFTLHQHPTGDPSPSSEDIAITRRLKEAGDIMGIKILDHIIIGDGEYLSFVERGLL